MAEKKERNSNIEALRILLMGLIVLLHFCKHGTIGESANNICNIFYCAILAISTCAVNCFVLISGYYGIEFSVHKFLKLWLQLFTLPFLIPLLFCFPFELSPSVLLQVVMPFSQNVWWFATNYLILMLIAPFINKLEENLLNRQLNALIVVLLVCFTVIPMISESPVLDTYGYDIVIFTLSYLIGRWLHRHKNSFEKARIIVLVAFAVDAVTMFVIPYFIHNTRVLWYNSPIVMIAAIALFVIFSNIKLGKIRLVNSIAQNTFAVYLISDHPVVRNWLYDFLPIKANIEQVTVIPYVFLFSIVVFVVCIVAEKVRIICFDRLENIVLGKIEKHLRLDTFKQRLFD